MKSFLALLGRVLCVFGKHAPKTFPDGSSGRWVPEKNHAIAICRRCYECYVHKLRRVR